MLGKDWLKLIIGIVAVLVLVAAGILWYDKQRGLEDSAAEKGIPFSVVDVAERTLDGAPALLVTLSHPLDVRSAYEPYVEVYAMPARPDEIKKKNHENRTDDEDEEAGDDESAVTDKKAKLRAVSTRPEDLDTSGGTRVAGAWVIGENPRLMYFPHVKPEQRYIVRVMSGLPSRAGQKLAAEMRYSVRTGAVSPAYYFASRGMVLPSRQNGGLPVLTVNVPEVDVQFLRVKDDQLSRFLDMVIESPRLTKTKNPDSDEGNGEGNGEDEEESYGKESLRGAVSRWRLDELHRMTQSVYVNRFVTEQRPNRRAVTFLPVEDIAELREPGVYIAVMSQPNRFRSDYQVTYFYVSDLGLSARINEKRADVFVSSLTDGKAVDGAEVSWLSEKGAVLVQAKTDVAGWAAFPEKPPAARLVMAKKSGQMSVILLKEPALDLSEFAVGGGRYRPVRLFAWSGRDLYRPGERVDVSVLARDADGRAIPAQPIQARLMRPDGKAQSTRMLQPEMSAMGYYRYVLEVPPDAATGLWSLELRSDPADKTPGTSYTFHVEEFLPERMKLDLSASDAPLRDKQPLAIKVRGSYLYGAPASGNTLLGVVQYERNANPLVSKLPGFEFGDFGDDHKKERKELTQTALDESGNATLDVDTAWLTKRNSPFTLRTTISLLESGGRPVVRNLERVWWPAAAMIGVRPLYSGKYTRENALTSFEVIRADAAGKLLPGAGLPVRLFRENREYYWRFDDQRGWNSGFNETDELVHSTTITVPVNGRSNLSVPVKYGRYRLEITDPATGMTTRLRFYAGSSAEDDETQGNRPDRVALKLDKPAYREGDTAVLTITPPHDGQALVTVEGDHVLWARRMSVSAQGETLAIPINKEWRRHDLYISVLALRPGTESDKTTPTRALGLIHLPLQRQERKLDVRLEAAKKMEPERPLQVKVKVPGAQGKKALVTLSAVDAGILNITNFTSPNPFAFFFGQQRYGMDHHDIYGRLIEKMAGMRGKLKFGGDSSAPQATKSPPKKVRLVDLFSGPVQLDAQGEATIPLSIPDFNGTLRLMAVVAAPEQFGAAEAETIVAAPVVAELATPRFLALGDKATIALDVHNLSGTAKNLNVTVTSDPTLIISQKERQIVLNNQQKTTLRFPVESSGELGLAAVHVNITGPGVILRREFVLQVQGIAPAQIRRQRISLAPGEALDLVQARNTLADNILPTTRESGISISSRPPVDVRSVIRGLLTYPYGCAEQTTSTAYPYVFVDEASAKRFGLKPFTRAEREALLEKALGRLAGYQTPSGGFGLWSGSVSEQEYWLSAYVTRFLLDARDQGFNVPERMRKDALQFLLKGLQTGVADLPQRPTRNTTNSAYWQDRQYGGSGRFDALSHGAYVLARENQAPLSTLRQIYDARANANSGLALVQLGIALRLMGDEARADKAITEGLAKPRDNMGWWGDYGSALRDDALIYSLLLRHQLHNAGRENILMRLADTLSRKGQGYTSTQEKMALFLVGRSMAEVSGASWSAELSLADKTSNLMGTALQFISLDSHTQQATRLLNTGKVPLYLELTVSGQPRTVTPYSKGIDVTRNYFTANGQPLGNRPLKVGESLLVRLTVASNYHLPNVLVVDQLPAGLEIENLNIAQGEGLSVVRIDGTNPATAMQDSRIDHVEFREDRFVAAVRFPERYGRQNMLLFYRVRVVTPGLFIQPPTFAEDMYNPDISSVGATSANITVMEAKTDRQ